MIRILLGLAVVLLTIGPVTYAGLSASDQVSQWTQGYELIQTTRHTDQTVEELYRDGDGGEIRVVYRPDGRIELFNAPAYQPPTYLPTHLAPLGAILGSAVPLANAAQSAYEEAVVYMAPKHPIAIDVEIGETIAPGEFVDTSVTAALTLFPRRTITIIPSTMHFSTDGEYEASRAMFEGRWIDQPTENPFPTMKTLEDYFSTARALGHRVADYEIVESVSLRVSVLYRGEAAVYTALALRLSEADDGQRLFILDNVLGELVSKAQETEVSPLTTDDLETLPGAADVLRDYGFEVSRNSGADDFDLPTDLPTTCCESSTEVFRYPDFRELSTLGHDGGFHKARVTWKLRCSCDYECQQTAQTTIETYQEDATYCEDFGLVFPTVHKMQSTYDGMTANAWNAVTFASAARADAGFICGMKSCIVPFCPSSLRIGVTAPPVNGAATFDVGNTEWRYQRSGGFVCPPCKQVQAGS